MRLGRIKIVDKISVFVILSLIVLLFQNILAKIVNVYNYYDEIFTIIIVLFAIYRATQRKNHISRLNISMYVLIAVVGIIGNFISKVNLNVFIIIVDLIGVLKVFVAYDFMSIFLSEKEKKCIIEAVSCIFRIYILMAIAFLIIGLALNINMLFPEQRYGLKSYSFICENAGNFGYLIMGITCFISMDSVHKKKNFPYIVMGLILCVATLKGPQMIFSSIYALFYLLHTKKIKPCHLAIAAIIVVILGQYQISNYFLNETSARYNLIVASAKITEDYFPIGTGLGTFGSEMSRRFYSPLYHKYGISNVYGLSEGYSLYINDNYWPMIFAQFGFVVGIVVLIRFVKLFFLINNKNEELRVKWLIMSCYMTMLIGSLGSAYLTSSVGVICFMAIGLYNNKEGLISDKHKQSKQG